MPNTKESKTKNQKTSKKKNRFSTWLPFVLWALVIFSFSSLSATPTVDTYWHDFVIKKTAHVVEFFVLSLLFYRALASEGVASRRIFIMVFAFGFSYAILDEIHQSYTPGRQPTARDVVIDTIGVILAIYFVHRLDYLKSRFPILSTVGNYLNNEK